jgi:hypothetical protein
MKVALNPAELRLIVDALDDKHQFQRQSARSRNKRWDSVRAFCKTGCNRILERFLWVQ